MRQRQNHFAMGNLSQQRSICSIKPRKKKSGIQEEHPPKVIKYTLEGVGIIYKLSESLWS